MVTSCDMLLPTCTCYYSMLLPTMTSLMRSIGIVHGPAKPAQWYFGWPLEDVLPSATPRKCWHWAAPGIVSRNTASSRAHRDQFNGTNNCGHVGNIWTCSTHYQLKRFHQHPSLSLMTSTSIHHHRILASMSSLAIIVVRKYRIATADSPHPPLRGKRPPHLRPIELCVAASSTESSATVAALCSPRRPLT
jgi:hypothetical protein